jgi:REP element-mobilizing transposase RayT
MYNRAFLTNNVNQNHPVDSVILQIKRNPAIRLPKSISSFIAGFKSAVNTKIDNFIDLHQLSIPKYNRNNHFFQPNYHDHIIRNESEFLQIKNYIKNNPLNWDTDQFNRE